MKRRGLARQAGNRRGRVRPHVNFTEMREDMLRRDSERRVLKRLVDTQSLSTVSSSCVQVRS